jgi:hypothetical protein
MGNRAARDDSQRAVKFHEVGIWDFAGNRPAGRPLTIAVLLCNPEVRVPLQNQLWLSRI